jgi:transposase
MKHKSKDLKLRAILYYYKSKNQTQTSKIFGCSPRTLMRWVNKFNNCYSFSKNNKMYLGYKLKQVHINNINNCLLQNKTITIKEFYLTVHKFKIKDIICIDETSLCSFLTRNYGYSKKGKRCVIQTNNQNVFKKYTGIFAMTTEGILSYTIYSKGLWIVID